MGRSKNSAAFTPTMLFHLSCLGCGGDGDCEDAGPTPTHDGGADAGSCLLDEFEPNDVDTEAASLTFPAHGSAVEIPTAGDAPLTLCDEMARDWYSLDLQHEDRARLDGQTVDHLEADMRAYAPGGGLLDTGHIGFSPEPLDFTADGSGEYLVEVVPVGGRSGAYRLNLASSQGEICIADALEPSNAMIASALTIGMTYSGLTLCEEEDWYVFTGTGNSMTVCAEFTHVDGDIDLMIFDDHNPGETVMGGSVTTTDNERVSLLASSAGAPYYARVWMESGGDTRYAISVSDGSVACPTP